LLSADLVAPNGKIEDSHVAFMPVTETASAVTDIDGQSTGNSSPHVLTLIVTQSSLIILLAQGKIRKIFSLKPTSSQTSKPIGP
jgi:hypothetical protein